MIIAIVLDRKTHLSFQRRGNKNGVLVQFRCALLTYLQDKQRNLW